MTPPLRSCPITTKLKLLTAALLLATSACVSTGTEAVTDAGVVSLIQVGKSTRADVTALLGYPVTASHDDPGEETWHYARTTVYPNPAAFLPLFKAVIPSLGEATREFAVTFGQDGTVKHLGPDQRPKSPTPSG